MQMTLYNRLNKHKPSIIIVVFCLFIMGVSLDVKAQSAIVTEFTDGVNDIVSSFMDNPYHHDNTVKIYDICERYLKLADEMLTQAPYPSTDHDYLSNVKGILRCLNFITGNIANSMGGGLDGGLFEYYFRPVLSAFGWTWKVVKYTDDIILYEYVKNNFKMMLTRNTRPAKDGGDYNAVTYECYTWQKVYKENYMFCGRVSFGGDYEVVQYVDDTINKDYHNVTRLTSKRGSTFK